MSTGSSHDSVSGPFNLERLIDHLLPVVSKWQELGVALSLDEDILDEIYTNNERDEDCLRDMLERYMKRSDLKHNWEEIVAALEKVNGSGDVKEETGSQPSLAHPQVVDRALKGRRITCVGNAMWVYGDRAKQLLLL